MSNIGEIMGAIGRHGDDCIRDGDAASESFEALREMIAAALAAKDAEIERLTGCSAPIGSGHIMTPREHWCGEFSTLHNPA